MNEAPIISKQETHKERDVYILESLRQACPLLHHLAIRYGQDFDDLYQIAAETVLKAYDRAQKVSNPRAYLHRAIRNQTLILMGISRKEKRVQRLEDHYQIESLDAPLRTDASLPLYDLVDDARSQLRAVTRDYSRLYALIQALPATYAQALCMHFGLCGYGEHALCDIARILDVPRNTVWSRVSRAKAMLQKYIELLDLVDQA